MSIDKTERKSGIAISGLIVAILALLGSAIPILNNVSFFFAVVSLALGVIGLISIKKGKRVGQGLAVTTIILSILTFAVVLATQSFYSKVAEDVGNSVNETINDSTGANTDKLLKDSVSVTIGKFTVTNNDYIDSTELPVTVKNKSSEKASFTIKIEAVDADGTRVADDTIYITDLNTGQSASEKAFQYVESGKIAVLKTAKFKVLEVAK